MAVVHGEGEAEEVPVPAPSPKRRRLNYQFLEEFVLAPPEGEVDPVDALRDAVRQWCLSKGRHVGDYRNPLLTARGWSVVGRCMQHVVCHQGDGKYFRFFGTVNQRPLAYVLSIETAGECGSEERVVRAAGGSQIGQPSVETRRKVLEAADSLLAMSCAATPTAVKLNLEPGVEAGFPTTVV